MDLRLDPLMVVLKRLVEFFRAIGRAFLALFGVLPQTSTDSLNVSTSGDLGPLGQYILSLTCNETARNQWITNRAQAISSSGLSTQDQNLLTAGALQPIVTQIVAESGGTGSRFWICIWIR